MKKRKGFTLIELLTVIAILSFLAVIGTPIVKNVQTSIRNRMYNAKVKMIKSAAEMCVEKNAVDDCNTVAELCTKKFLDVEKSCGEGSVCACQMNPATKGSMDNCAITIETVNYRWKATFPVVPAEDEEKDPNCFEES